MAEAAAASDKARSVANNFGATCFRVRRDGAPELDGRRCQKRRQKRFVRLAEETPNIGEEKGTQKRLVRCIEKKANVTQEKRKEKRLEKTPKEKRTRQKKTQQKIGWEWVPRQLSGKRRRRSRHELEEGLRRQRSMEGYVVAHDVVSGSSHG